MVKILVRLTLVNKNINFILINKKDNDLRSLKYKYILKTINFGTTNFHMDNENRK